MAEETAATIVVIAVVIIVMAIEIPAFLTSMNTKPDVHISAICGAAPAIVVCSTLDLTNSVGNSLAVSLLVKPVYRAMHNVLILLREKKEAAARMIVAAVLAVTVVIAAAVTMMVVVMLLLVVVAGIVGFVITIVVVLTAQLASIIFTSDVFRLCASHHASMVGFSTFISIRLLVVSSQSFTDLLKRHDNAIGLTGE